jgi:hypothetical protein
MKENRSNSIPDDLQDALIRECQMIRNRHTYIHVSAQHEFWKQQYQSLEQYREQVIALVGPRQADEILLSLYFGGRVSKQERAFSILSLSTLNKIGKISWNTCIDRLKGIGEHVSLRSVGTR